MKLVEHSQPFQNSFQIFMYLMKLQEPVNDDVQNLRGLIKKVVTIVRVVELVIYSFKESAK